MSDWQENIAAATAAAEKMQAAEGIAESRFDAVHAQPDAVSTEEFRDWMAARHATDAAWGTWSQVMDSKPAG